MISIIPWLATFLIAQADASDRVRLSDVFQFDPQAEFNHAGIRFHESLRLDLKTFSIYPSARVIAETLDHADDSRLEIWVENRDTEIVRLTGSISKIRNDLRFEILESELNAIEAYGDRLIFSKLEKNFQPDQLRTVFDGAKGLAIGVGALYLLRKAHTAKKIVTAIRWVGRGLEGAQAVATVAAAAPTPEKFSGVGLLIELGTVVVLEIAATVVLDRIQLKLERDLVEEGLLQDIKAFEENVNHPAAPLARTAQSLILARILKQFEDLQLMMNVDSNKKVRAAEASIERVIQKLIRRRKADEELFRRTFYFTKKFERTRTYRTVSNLDLGDQRPGVPSFKFETITEITPEERLNSTLSTFLIRNAYPRLREYQKLRASMNERMKTESELTDEELRLRARAEKTLRDSYYLTLFRDEFDQAVNEAQWDLTTPLKDKYSYGIFKFSLFHLGVRHSLEENLKKQAGSTRVFMESLNSAATHYSRIKSSQKAPTNAYELMYAQLGFVMRALNSEAFKNQPELLSLKQRLEERIQKALAGRYNEVAESLIHHLLQRWMDAYLTRGVGISVERAMILKGLFPENPETLNEWTEADLMSLVR